ncbi:AI-2E family transporter [Pseudonocardia spinosispora]|uniref:AI-2E family transporter n=1 Tax=Pseudonocardia spinosispora TaxID=103441 RepID=UPI00041F8352|nr:AI-2E family transporter [Pseudonocardia spinosispora]
MDPNGTNSEEVPPPGKPHLVVPTGLRVASEICARFLVIAVALAAVIFILIELRIVVIPVAIALLIAALLAPLVNSAMTHAKLPRGIATGLVLVGGMALFGAVMSFVINAFIAGLPDLQAKLVQSYEITIKPLLAGKPLRIPLAKLNDLPGELQRSLAANADAITTGALTTAATLSEVVSALLLGLFVLIFFLYDGSQIWHFLLRGIPLAQRNRVDIAGQRGFASLVGYTRATAVVAVVDALAIGVGLWIIGVPLVVPLAALVFLGAFIPVVGAVLSGFVAVAVALVANGPIPALIVLAVIIGVVQLESHVLQPLLMGRAVQLHPLAVVLSVAGGVVVAGVIGALLAVPLAAVIAAAVRSLASPDEPQPRDVNPLDPDFAKAGPGDPAARRRLLRIATGIVRRPRK